jgi:hypothetical protein
MRDKTSRSLERDLLYLEIDLLLIYLLLDFQFYLVEKVFGKNV